MTPWTPKLPTIAGSLVFVIASPTDVDQVGFVLRNQGFDVRDAVMILTTEGTRFAVLARKSIPTSALDVVVTEGLGSLNIDASRISTSDNLDGGLTSSGKAECAKGANPGYDRPWMHDEDLLERKKKEAMERVEKAQAMGRWPANVMLRHGSECVQEGTKKVKGATGNGDALLGEASDRIPLRRGEFVKRTDSEGNEEVPNWVCQPGCPVAEMDSQGVLRGAHSAGCQKESYYAPTTDKDDPRISFGAGSYVGIRHGDSGGVSRFFKQVRTQDEITEYLGTMIGTRSCVIWLPATPVKES